MVDKSMQSDNIQMKRVLGPFAAANLIVSTMIGSGIFVSASSALKYSGSVGMCLVVWAVCGLICFLGMYDRRLLKLAVSYT